MNKHEYSPRYDTESAPALYVRAYVYACVHTSGASRFFRLLARFVFFPEKSTLIGRGMFFDRYRWRVWFENRIGYTCLNLGCQLLPFGSSVV